MAPPGLTALGAKGSVRDRLTPPGRAPGFRPREVYSIAALARYGALMDKLLWSLRVDGPSGRRFLRGLSLTRLWREGCCGRLILLKAPFYNKTFTTGLRPLENHTTALRARKCIPPLVAGATTFPPQAGALWMLSNGIMSLQESIECFILSPGWGESPAQPDKGEPRSG